MQKTLLAGVHERDSDELAVPNQNKKSNKKRAASDLDLANTENSVDYGEFATCF